MRKKLIWIAAALVLIAVPAVIGLVALRGDDGSSSARRAGALVPLGGATEYQLQLVPSSTLGMASPTGKDAIEVESFSWGATNPTEIGSATGGAGAGKIQFNEFHITKKVDRASPLIFKNEAAGAHYSKAILSLRKTGTKDPYMTYTMETVFTTNVSHGGTSPNVATEEITFVYGKLIIQSVEAPEVAPVQAGWDQVLNKAAQ